jgi:hypothetical protein
MRLEHDLRLKNWHDTSNGVISGLRLLQHSNRTLFSLYFLCAKENGFATATVPATLIQLIKLDRRGSCNNQDVRCECVCTRPSDR